MRWQRIFCGLTSTDGFQLLGREKVDKFDWKMLKGKEVLGFRRFSLRGVAKARGEWNVVCLAVNLKRLHRIRMA